MSNIDYEMELLANSNDSHDRDKALKYFQNRSIKQDKEAEQNKPSWQRKTAADIMSTDYPAIRWAVKGIIPEGLSIITGSPKSGKSWLAIHLCTAVSHGGCFMNYAHVDQREVLYLALEDNERRIKDHLIKQGGLANDKLFIETPETWKGGIVTLREYLKKYTETGLVIIDTLFKFNPLEDSNEYSKSYKPIALLQELAIQYSIPILLVHHTRKGSHNNTGEGWADEGLGSTGIIGAVDTILMLQKPDGKNEGKLRIKGRDVEEKSFDLVFDKDICTWRITRESDVVTKGDPKAQAEVLSLFENNPEGLKTGDIAVTLGKKDNAISNILRILDGKGKIKKQGNKWIYSQLHDNSLMNNIVNLNNKEFINSDTPRDNKILNSDSKKN